MTRSNNYTAPYQPPPTINIDPDQAININLTQSPKRMYQQFLLSDDTRFWHSIPKKQVTLPATLNDYTVDGTVDAIVIPFVYLSNFKPSWFDTDDLKRRLFLNTLQAFGTTDGAKMPIKIDRPMVSDGEGGTIPAKAYLHTLSYSAYDFNEMIPYLDIIAICEDIFVESDPEGGWGIDDLIVEDAFGSGYDGLIIGKYEIEGGLHYYPFRNYTTADYPLIINTNSFSNLKGKRANELAVIDKLSQSAPCSSIFRGMLPSDWMANNFGITIGGHTGETIAEDSAPTSIIWDSRNRESFADTLNYAQSFGEGVVVGYDSFFPAVNNEIDIEIPDDVNYLFVDVRGPGWYHGIDIVNHGLSYNTDPVKGWLAIEDESSYRGPLPIPITIVKMPVKIHIALRFAEE